MDVASWFLTEGAECMGEHPTHMKLQKLLYYAQGAFLALKDELLFEEDIRAWDHGPVVPKVYNKYKKYGNKKIIIESKENNISKDDRYLLEAICSLYGAYTASQLRNMSHESGPWKNTERLDVIDSDAIKEYFKKYVFADILSGEVFNKLPLAEEKRNEDGRLVYPI